MSRGLRPTRRGRIHVNIFYVRYDVIEIFLKHATVEPHTPPPPFSRDPRPVPLPHTRPMAAMASSSCLPSACRPAPARPARAAAGAVMASAAPPPTGRGATPSTSREVSASAAAFAPTFAPTCPWPRTTEYGSYEPAARGGVGWKAWLNKVREEKREAAGHQVSISDGGGPACPA